jgi:hypothetical protein
MDRTLWLLLWLRFRGWQRRMRSSLYTTKGLLFALAGVLFLLPCMCGWIGSFFLLQADGDGTDRLEAVQRFGPLALLGMSLLNVVTASGERAVVAFTPAEVNYLFAGPFSRRQLLGFKLLIQLLSLLVLSALMLLMSSFLRLEAGSIWLRYLGIVLAMVFMQLLAVALGFLAAAIGARAFNRGRKLVLGLLLGVLLFSFLRLGGEALQQNSQTLLIRLEQSVSLQAILTPFRWFILAITAERFWPDFAYYGGLGLAIDLGMLLLVFVLDVHYLESAAAASERIYAQLQRLRSGGPAAVMLRSTTRYRFHMPGLPRWGGVGPVAWRQLTTVPRSRASFVLAMMLLPLLAIPVLASLNESLRDSPAPGLLLGAQVIALTVFLSPFVAFDFRGDLDHMDLLKSLPIGSVPLVTGQLLVPVLLISLIQGIGLIVIALSIEHAAVLQTAATALAFVLPFNFLLFAVENLLFLLFPTRTVMPTGVDVQAMGRQALLTLAKMLGMGLVSTTAAMIGLVCYLLLGRSMVAAVTAAWLVVAGFAAGLVPLVAWAFRRFDVARDTPP